MKYEILRAPNSELKGWTYVVLCVRGRAQGGGKWLKLFTYTCGQSGSNQDEAVHNILRTCMKIPLSGNAVV